MIEVVLGLLATFLTPSLIAHVLVVHRRRQRAADPLGLRALSTLYARR